MRRISKSGIPQSLVAFNRTPHGDWADIHRPENRNVYEDCLERCSSDQGNRCGHTEISMTADSKHIDHYIKRALAPYLTFDWRNMIAAVNTIRVFNLNEISLKSRRKDVM